MAKSGHGGPRFATTHWSLVRAAGGPSSAEAKAALEALCEAYWYPLYAFIRRRGHGPEEVRDLTQAFFATFLEKRFLHAADCRRGRFRSFLMATCANFLGKELERGRALKRGGGRRTFSLDFEAAEGRYLREPADEMTPERLYERRWAMTLLDRVVTRLGEEYALAGKSPLFGRLRGTLTGDHGSATYREIGEELGMTEGAVKVAAHRVRRRFRELLREEISRVVSAPEEIDDEIRLLFEAVRAG
jgi:RNA polymerase sigma factor (sigma-70 family)